MTDTERLFDKNAYLTECSAAVLSVRRIDEGVSEKETSGNKDIPEAACAKYEVVLDRTVFFPEGGGQSSDIGWICSAENPGCENDMLEVTDVQIADGVIRHTVSCPSDREAPYRSGDAVSVKIKRERRFGFMQNHTGEHILSGLMHKRYGFDNIGFHLSDNSVTLDVNGQLDEVYKKDGS